MYPGSLLPIISSFFLRSDVPFYESWSLLLFWPCAPAQFLRMYPDKPQSAIHRFHHSIPGLPLDLSCTADICKMKKEGHTTNAIIHSTRLDCTRYMPLILAVESDTTILTSARSRFIRSIRTVAVIVIDCRMRYCNRSIDTCELILDRFVTVVYC